MKKILAAIAALALAACMTSTAMAAGSVPSGNTQALAVESGKVVLDLNTFGNGTIEGTIEGSTAELKQTKNAVVTLDKGQKMTLKATADAGNSFICWKNDATNLAVSSEPVMTVTASENLSLTAVFDNTQEDRLLITAKTSGAGTIEGTDDGSSPVFDPAEHNTQLVFRVLEGDIVTLAAKADTGYSFICWMDEDSSDIYSMEQKIRIRASKAVKLVAVFNIDSETALLRAKTSGDGEVGCNAEGGEVEFDPVFPKLSIKEEVPLGSSVVLEARANEGSRFVEWQNDDTGEVYSREAKISVRVYEAMNLTAVFAASDGTVEEVSRAESQAASGAAESKAESRADISSYSYSYSSQSAGMTVTSSPEANKVTDGSSSNPASGTAALGIGAMGLLAGAVMTVKRRR